jgi:hypothetical protein
MFGLLWGVHIKPSWRRRARRWSGGILFGGVVWLAASGLGIYYLENPEILSWLAVGHWTAGILAASAYVLHRHLRARAA